MFFHITQKSLQDLGRKLNQKLELCSTIIFIIPKKNLQIQVQLFYFIFYENVIYRNWQLNKSTL